MVIPSVFRGFHLIGPATHRMDALSGWPWHVHCSTNRMTIDLNTSASQQFDDSHFFQRLTLIDICCGPPLKVADCQLPIVD